MPMQAMANVNGVIGPLADAKISILDRGFLYGDSVYEVVRTYDGVPFFFSEHMDRLENSARLAYLKISQSREFLMEEIKKTALATGVKKGEDVFVRYTVTRGAGPIDLDPKAAPQSSYVIFAKELPRWKPEHYSTGMKLVVPGVRRNSPRSIDPNIKSGNYLNNILAVAQAKEKGGDDCLMLSIDGNITEASNSNVLFIKDGIVLSPLHEPMTHTGHLRGLTKLALQKVCITSGVGYQERRIVPTDVADATECFVSSATREIMPVQEILWDNDRRQKFAIGGGSVIKKLQQGYKDYLALHILEHSREAWF